MKQRIIVRKADPGLSVDDCIRESDRVLYRNKESRSV